MAVPRPRFFPTLGVGLLYSKFNSSPRPFSSPVYSSLIPGGPNPRVSLESPIPECCWSAQPQSVLAGVPNPRVSLVCPTTKYLCPERVEKDVRSKTTFCLGLYSVQLFGTYWALDTRCLIASPEKVRRLSAWSRLLVFASCIARLCSNHQSCRKTAFPLCT